MSLVFSRGKLVDGDFSGALRNALIFRIALSTSACRRCAFGHDPGYRATMSGDDYGLPTLDVIEKLGKVSLGLRGLNFAHAGNPEL